MNEPLIIACDIDGVLCEGPYLPVEERTAERYAAMRPYTDAIARFRAERPANAIVYYITSRRRHLWRPTLHWLHTHVEANAQLIAGVDPANKPYVAFNLGCSWMFDDDPETILDVCGTEFTAAELRGRLIANPSRGDYPSIALASIGDAWSYIAAQEALRARP